MAEKTEFVLGANFGTPYGSGSQLIFFSNSLIIYSYNNIVKYRGPKLSEMQTLEVGTMEKQTLQLRR
jgi:hypothetical protein